MTLNKMNVTLLATFACLSILYATFGIQSIKLGFVLLILFIAVCIFIKLRNIFKQKPYFHLINLSHSLIREPSGS